ATTCANWCAATTCVPPPICKLASACGWRGAGADSGHIPCPESPLLLQKRKTPTRGVCISGGEGGIVRRIHAPHPSLRSGPPSASKFVPDEFVEPSGFVHTPHSQTRRRGLRAPSCVWRRGCPFKAYPGASARFRNIPVNACAARLF